MKIEKKYYYLPLLFNGTVVLMPKTLSVLCMIAHQMTGMALLPLGNGRWAIAFFGHRKGNIFN